MKEPLQRGSAAYRSRKEDWIRFYKASALKYQMNALLAVYENNGEEMLRDVLDALGLERSSDLVKDAATKQ